MKLLFTLTFAHFFFIASSQTPLIAHKSHAGNSTSFFIDPSSNFGAIRMDFEKPHEPVKLYMNERFIPLNDSTMILEVRDLNQQVIKIDTLSNQKRYSNTIFQYKYQDSIRKMEELKQEEQLKLEEEEKKQLELQQQQLNESPKKNEKKSYLLFLFGITGGGMLFMRLFSRSKITKPSIAKL